MTKPTLKLIPREDAEKEQWATDNPRPRKELTPPHFPDHSEREISHGTLRYWLDKLCKK